MTHVAKIDRYGQLLLASSTTNEVLVVQPTDGQVMTRFKTQGDYNQPPEGLALDQEDKILVGTRHNTIEVNAFV